MNQYVAFLRGINVGGHHKVPMAELRKLLTEHGLKNVITLLNSGNIIFGSPQDQPEQLEEMIATKLEKHFGFPVPTIVRQANELEELYHVDPFRNIEVTKDIRLYVSFLKEPVDIDVKLPWSSDDGSYRILQMRGKNILSVLDLAVSKTPRAMDALENFYGKDITTRNWNTVERVLKKLRS